MRQADAYTQHAIYDLFVCAVDSMSPGDRLDQASPLSGVNVGLFDGFLGKLTGVVCHCLPLGVFGETPSLSVDVLHRPSFRLLVSDSLGLAYTGEDSVVQHALCYKQGYHVKVAWWAFGW